MMDMNEICTQAVKHFGSDSQTLMCIEEMSELQKELCKHSRGRNNCYDIAEEIADVQIMLEQMIILFDCRESVEDWKIAKLFRLKELMNNDADS